jgi:crossover junction endodeoxyribonuclease RuvC
MSRILGLDPGLQVTGYAVVEATPQGPVHREAGVIRSAHDGRDTSELADRVKVLYDSLVEILDEWKPGVLAVEQLYAHYDHPRTAILMAHARGCYFLAAAQRGIPTVSYAPARVKKTITGHGRATKEQMQAAIQRELNLAKLPEPHDVADALAIALCHYYSTATTIVGGSRSATFTPVNRDALFGPDAAEDEEA